MRTLFVRVWLTTIPACAAPPAAADAAELTLAGAIAWEAHLARPHATMSVAATLRLWRDGERARVELRETSPHARAAEVTTFVRDADGTCWALANGRKDFVRDDGAGERLLRLLLAATAQDREAATIRWQHPRLGDVEDRAEWQPGADGPELHVRWQRATDAGDMTLCRSPAPRFDAAATQALGERDAAPPIAARDPAPPQFRTLAPGVHAVTLPDVGSRSLAVEFADHVVLCETSLDNRAGERLLAALDEHLPGKPVRYVLFGHYHPHYTGGLRPVMARGATVIAPPLGAAFAREIAERPFRSPPDALAASGRAPAIETFSGERAFRDGTNELVAIDIGKHSHHTDEYVVFWLPRQGLLFEGDLGWYEGPDGLRGGGERARGMLQAIDDRHLPVQTLVQSWPTTGPSTLPLAELRALLAR